MKISTKVSLLDQEEKDLIKAINDIDVNKITKPDAKTQQKFYNAAKSFFKTNIQIDTLEQCESHHGLAGVICYENHRKIGHQRIYGYA